MLNEIEDRFCKRGLRGKPPNKRRVLRTPMLASNPKPYILTRRKEREEAKIWDA